MKTKHLLTALALPAVFAACTAEDIVTEGVSVGQAERIALNENFKLDFGGLESRLNAGEPGAALTYAFEKGDMVGGAIIDNFEPDYTADTPEEYENQYKTQYYVSANQPFTYDGAAWTLEHTMVEGKYLFYYPYNTANNSRGAAKFSIPVMQDLSDPTTGEFDPKAAVERYGMAVGYQFLSNEDLSASVELAPIFSYARIVMTLDNQYAGGEVEKIVLQADKEFNLNGLLDNKKIEAIFKAKKTGKYEVDGTKFDWDNHTTTAAFEMGDDVEKFYNKDFDKGSSIIVGKVPAGTKMTKDAQNNHTFETYMVVPAQADITTLTAYLYTKDGAIYSGPVVAKKSSDSKIVFNRNTPKKLTVELGINDIAVPYVISSQDDWNNSVSMMSKDEVANFIIADSEFALNNESKFPKNGTVIVDKVAVSGNNVTMANVWANEVTVKKGAKLNADASLVAKKIVNEGEVVVAEIPEVESKAQLSNTELEKFIAANYWISEIENKGTLTVEEGAELTGYQWSFDANKIFKVENTSNGTVEVGLKLTNKKDGIVANAGTITVWGTNEGTINNAGAINIFEAEVETDDENDEDGVETVGFTNLGREYELVDSEKLIYEVVNEPTINNATTGEIRATVGDLTNKSLIVNAGILSCGNNDGKITNDEDTQNAAVIEAKTNSITLITSNTNGKVIVSAMKQENVSIKSGAGAVEYTADADITIDESIVTDVVVTKSITITQGSDATKNGSLKNLKVAADATITLVAPTTNAKTFSSIEVAEGKKMTLGSSLETAKLIVNEKASVVVPKELTLKVTGEDANFKNAGTIVVTGSLLAEKVAKVNGGIVLDNGGTGSIDWEDTKEEAGIKEAKAEYLHALKNAMYEWIETSGTNESYQLGGNCDYNLNDSLYVTIENVKYKGAKEVFAKWLSWSSAKRDKVAAKFEAYNDLLEAAEEEVEESIAFGYDTAKDSLITEVKATDDYKSNVVNAKFKVTITNTQTDVNFFAADAENVFASDGTSETVKYSAEFKALEAFRKYVMASTLSKLEKTVLCSITSYETAKAYVPDYTFAFETDNVYKLYNEVIAVYSDAEFGNNALKADPVVLTAALSDDSTVGYSCGIVEWVKAAANVAADATTSYTPTAADNIAKEYVTATIDNVTYAIYKESLKWKYSDKTIEAIAGVAKANN